MKKLLYILTFILFSQTGLLSQEYWLKQNSPTEKDLSDCFFSDTLNGWIGGDSGLILHTSNGGNSWTFQNSGVHNSIHSFYFLNELSGFALSFEFDNTPPAYFGTRILSTSNGGNNWSNALFADTNVFLNSIYFLDPLKGFTGGSNGIIYYTTNTGATWSESIIDSGFAFGFPVIKFGFFDNDIGFASGGSFDIAGQIFKTTDGGLNWKSRIVGPEPVLDLYVIDSMNILGAGGDFEYGASVLKTTNSGANWIYNELGIFGISNAIGYRVPNEIWISLGLIDSMLLSTNGGTSWILKPTPGNSILSDMTFANYRNGWAVGKEGVILKYNSSLINIFNNSLTVPVNFELFQNYPNPFNPTTNLEFGISELGYVTLKVYDAVGKEVATLVNEVLSPGNYNYQFSTINSQLASGIYFYSLYADGVLLDTKRMVLLK